MKACVLHAVGDLRYEDVPDPIPGPDEVLLKIRAAGVCGSDVQRVFEKGTYHFPTIPGHEFAGEIVAAHNSADTPLIGKRAAVFPILPCRACAACEAGEFAQCENYDYYGSRRDGGFAEYLAVKTWNLVFIPDNISFEEAAMCEPCAVAIHALSRADTGPGDTVAIYGSGTIGILLAKLAMLRGAKDVVLIDIDPLKIEAARRLGFTRTVNSLEKDAPGEIHRLTNGRGADIVIEGAGASAALENCVKSAKAFGRVVLMGNPLGDMTLSRDAYSGILRRQLTLCGTWNSNYSAARNDWTTAMDAMPLLGLRDLITHRFPLEAGVKAIEVLRDKNEFVMKSMYVL